MTSQDSSNEITHQDVIAEGDDRDNDALTSKLSNELNNWRRRRTHGRPKRNEGERVKSQTESARTIKLRGHETLVVRKPKVLKSAVSPRTDQ